jgi:hypothetical protein
MPKPIGANVEFLEDVETATPYLIPHVAEKFRKLRALVIEKAGFDFLANLADAMRPADFQSSKTGVANRSWHKTGRAIDVDQSSPHLVIVREDKGSKTYFRVYLRTTNSHLGIFSSKQDVRGFTVKDNLFDFTAAAESLGFERIPAWKGWSTKGKGYNLQEWWHYQVTDGLTWADAMAVAYPDPEDTGPKVETGTIGLNDRGIKVKTLQGRLAALGYLPQHEVDGVFGAKSFAALKKFQADQGLVADGVAGPLTRKALGL